MNEKPACVILYKYEIIEIQVTMPTNVTMQRRTMNVFHYCRDAMWVDGVERRIRAFWKMKTIQT